ncbi:MAG: PhzF family phenazine biosynthesis isomerase, partial [Woeseiaceae bacterium]|nr:PhzF family phenazine biosynthesis isomerase [Woeseiaceae bacterium]
MAGAFDGKLYQLASFSIGDAGGNPAGVWIGEKLPDAATMQQIAADVGASETAFIAPTVGSRRTIRYFSPEVEVSFCGHATIASGVVLGRKDGEGTYVLDTSIGEVEVTAKQSGSEMSASLQSVPTEQKRIAHASLQEALNCLGWDEDDLDPGIPPINAFAGAWHYILAVGNRDTLANLDYAFDALKALMLREGLTTLQLIWRERDDFFHSRNPFPIGGILEDPATGAAAAALGGYLRD